VGSRTLPVFIKLMQKAYEQKDDSIEVLRAAIDQGKITDAVKVMQLAERLNIQRDYANALKYLQHAVFEKAPEVKNSAPYQELLYKIKVAQAPTISEEVEIKKEGLQKVEQGVWSMVAAAEVAEFYDQPNNAELAQKYWQQALARSQYLLANPQFLEQQDEDRTEVRQYQASYFQKLGQKQASLDAYRSLTQDLENEYRERCENKKRQCRALALHLISAYTDAGSVAEARAWIEKYQKSFPNEATFYVEQADLEFRHGDKNAAIALVQQALQKSYGDNKISTAALALRIYKDLEKNELAQKLIALIRSEFADQMKEEVSLSTKRRWERFEKQAARFLN